MVLLICLDNRNGISFNRRRQSADRCVYERILDIAGENKIWVRPYSEGKFPADRITVTDEFSNIADTDGWCFAEDETIIPLLDCFEKIVVYRWNRDYPSDVVFPGEYLNMYRKVFVQDFPGNSHDVITEEWYMK